MSLALLLFAALLPRWGASLALDAIPAALGLLGQPLLGALCYSAAGPAPGRCTPTEGRNSG
jgi:hypothetical protein